jgi:hypothetical protein
MTATKSLTSSPYNLSNCWSPSRSISSPPPPSQAPARTPQQHSPQKREKAGFRYTQFDAKHSARAICSIGVPSQSGVEECEVQAGQAVWVQKDVHGRDPPALHREGTDRVEFSVQH